NAIGGGRRQIDVVRIDVATGARTTLVTLDGHDHFGVSVSPDGRWFTVVREERLSIEHAVRVELWLHSLGDDGPPSGRRLAATLDRWPTAAVFTADSTAVLFTADDDGRASVYRVGVDGDGDGEPMRLCNAGALSDLQIGPDSGTIHALRSTVGTPPEIVAFEATAADQEPRVVHAAAAAEPWPGTAVEVRTVAADGTELRAWLVLPDAPADGAAPPLAVFIHGGPLSSWNAWSWRWQPQLLAARGYAVLLPDPALSTGYGQAMIERGWQEWGGRPYTDVLALTDAALAQHHLDPDRTAVLGGSYGGYLTNWVVGHTDRFKCAVTHAALWDLTQFQGTTDDTVSWTDWWGDPDERAEFYREWSPSTYGERIVTPLLVVHGERDFRVPVGEGIRLWTELSQRGVESAFLYLPDENHWVLKPGNVRVWYDAVIGWLDRFLGDGGSARPDLV
ncbi:MAG: peptidase prolyl oligopeptidase active site domain protein, partial [Ilumatobacteraceae bacterium]|nr:peptidase prolyl oligopeptidase active site domain protein [Ilumatobacteraceae bacterium]